jgi:hypothetical protein
MQEESGHVANETLELWLAFGRANKKRSPKRLRFGIRLNSGYVIS